ncbi:hypothetical protein RCO28_38800 [Streptomyces sp. LHD-70]|uniref:hypothetical protein n=1 Tax=Streptomyces sp. LHD-70 TaxID=3072140 RepID=UPI00280E311C|nr:hypothetical protein [Streptomyces sp. LHD-70]MDQ8708365.1 hypothetical protein [Streptomyces sp. LHD-70]
MKVTFKIPPIFQPFTPSSDAESTRAEALARMADWTTQTAQSELDELADTYSQTAALLDSAGVFYAATCLTEFHGELSSGTLTMASTPLSYNDARTATAGIAEILDATPSRERYITVLPMPCGQVTLAIDQSAALRIPAQFSRTGEDIPINVAQLQAFIPVPAEKIPGAQELITVTFSTPSTHHWEEYCAILAELLRSLDFGPAMTSA